MNADKEMRKAILNKGLAEGIILDGGLGDILERMSRLTKYGIEEEDKLKYLSYQTRTKNFQGVKN